MQNKKRVLEVGEMFGFWKVIKDGDKSKIECICTGCNEVSRKIERSTLLGLKIKSCGCKQKELSRASKENPSSSNRKIYRSIIEEARELGLNYSYEVDGYHILFTKEPRQRDLGMLSKLIKKTDYLPGEIVGDWKILSFVGGVSYLLCECQACEARTQRVMYKRPLKAGQTRSCGCRVPEKTMSNWKRLREENKVQEITNKRKKACLEKYGKTSYAKTEECREKTIRTNLEKYGYSYHMQTPKFRESLRKTNFKEYKPSFKQRLIEIKQKAKASKLDGDLLSYSILKSEIIENVHSLSELNRALKKEQHLIKTILIEADNKWREENKDLINQIKFKKRTQTNLERFGSPVPPVKPETIEKIKQTNLERYGATTILATPELREKTKKSHLEKYGVENCFQSEKFQKEIKPQINLEKYGTENPGTLPSSIEKGKQTSLKKYGVDSFSKLPEERQKRREKNMEMETSFSSKGELAILEHVKQRFPDVRKLKIKHHELDIFIPELNFGIEFNGLCYHHVKAKHPYYHLAKSDFFKRHQIDIVHIWDYEFNKFKDQVLNFIDLRIDFQMKKLINHQFSFSYSKNPEKIKKVTSLQKDFYRFDRKDILAIVEVFDSKGSLVGSVSLQNYQGKPIIRNYFSYSSKILNLQIGLAAKKFLEDLFKQKYPILIDRRFYFDFSDLNLVEYFEPLKFWQIRGRFLKDGDFNLAPLQTIDLEKESDILISRNENLYELESEVWDCGAAIYL